MSGKERKPDARAARRAMIEYFEQLAGPTHPRRQRPAASGYRCVICNATAPTAGEIEAHVAEHVKAARVLDALGAEKARGAARGRARGTARARADLEAKRSAENATLRARGLDLKRRRGLSWRAVASVLEISRERLKRILKEQPPKKVASR